MTEEAAARLALPEQVFAYYAGGSGSGETIEANAAAWARWRLLPRALRDVSTVDTATTVLGEPTASPVGVAPTAFHGLAHPDGEAATAAGAQQAEALYVHSTRSSRPVEDVTAARWWFQVYVFRDRGVTRDLVQRAKAAGSRALVLTADTPRVANRGTGRFDVLSAATMREALGAAPEITDDLLEQAPDVTPADIGWLREVSGLPVVVKGILRPDDAHAATEAGAAAIWVSNHGGRQLDGAAATADVLEEVAASTELDTYVDGGVHTGRDVLRALALGARAVFLGRPVLWGLATHGAQGVADVLARYNQELEESMALAGAPTIADVTRDLVTR